MDAAIQGNLCGEGREDAPPSMSTVFNEVFWSPEPDYPRGGLKESDITAQKAFRLDDDKRIPHLNYFGRLSSVASDVPSHYK